MKCYNHPERDCVAICKACGKAICHECSQESENGIACQQSCINSLSKKNDLYINQAAHLKSLKRMNILGSFFSIGISSNVVSWPPGASPIEMSCIIACNEQIMLTCRRSLLATTVPPWVPTFNPINPGFSLISASIKLRISCSNFSRLSCFVIIILYLKQ